jgi:ubiquinone/menaquinone biosynthesis C-methylase UbiE
LQKNKRFLKKYPSFIPPPYYINFETTNSVDLEYYFKSGFEHAIFIQNLITKYSKNKNNKTKILDWGCGTSRVLRHVDDDKYLKFGVDYNDKSIEYNQKKIKNASFAKCRVNPPLPFEDSFFDAVYSISVFTHLSERTIESWLGEMHRVIRNGGLHIFTVNGDYFENGLNTYELLKYRSEGKVFRSNYMEGKKWYTSYTHKSYIEKIIKDKYELREFIPGPSFSFFSQDFFILEIVK